MTDHQDLHAACARIVPWYQPVVDLNTGAVIGAEMLARIASPDGSFRSPGNLISRIETDTALLELFMERLISGAAAELPALFPKFPGFYVSVNVPPVMLGTGFVAGLLQSVGLDAFRHRLVCEITERQALTDTGRDALARAREQGIKVAVDDFGTGQSGIRQLMGLDLDILKVDKSQIDPLLEDRSAERLLRGIVALALVLKVKVVAEGVETREQAFFLRAAGVDAGQGWLWSKAVPGSELPGIVKRGYSGSTLWRTQRRD